MNISQGFITLDEAVKNYLYMKGNDSTHNYLAALNIAKRGLRELGWDISNSPKEIEVDIDHSTNSIIFPQDYITYIQISHCFGGNKVALVHNPSMCKPGYDVCGNPVKVDGGNMVEGRSFTGVGDNSQGLGDGGIGLAYGLGNYNPETWENTGGQYGRGGGYSSIAYYKEDRTNRRIYLSEMLNVSTLTLTYVSSEPQRDASGRTVMHIFLQEALDMYLWWHEVRFRMGMTGESQARQRMYLAQKNKAHERLVPIRMTEMIDAVRRSYQQAPKI